MEKASAVMYSIANFFTWILVFVSIAMIVLSGLSMAGIIAANQAFGPGLLAYWVIVLVIAIITIAMVRRAKAKGTSKGWDVLFLVLGIIGANIFYFLGGLFGLIARR